MEKNLYLEDDQEESREKVAKFDQYEDEIRAMDRSAEHQRLQDLWDDDLRFEPDSAISSSMTTQ